MSEEAREIEEKTVRTMAMPAKKVPVVKPAQRAAMPVKEMPKKASPRTVKGKIAAINTQMNENQRAVANIYSGVRAIQSGINEQMKENQEATAKIQSGVRAMQTDIKGKIEVFKEAVANIHSGVRAIQSAISEQINENQVYARDFYG